MDKLWKSKIISRTTKLKIFNSSVKAILFYASESWTILQQTINRLEVFVNRCLQRILGVHRPDKITNKELWTQTGQEPVLTQLRRWNWLGHIEKK